MPGAELSAPELRRLRIFLAVAEQLSFTAAARSLKLKQQSVSKAVVDLERELGVDLLWRTTREVRLTEAGRLLAERARDLLRLAENTYADVRAAGQGRSGRVRVGFNHEIGARDLNAAIRALHGAVDGSWITVADVRQSELRSSLLMRNVDVALVASDGTNDPALHRADLRPTVMSVYAKRGHRLAGASGARLADFEGDRLLICHPAGSPYTDLQIGSFAAAGVSVEMVEGFVDGGMTATLTQLPELDAICLLPSETATPEGVVEIEVPDVTLPLRVLWPAGHPPAAVGHLVAGLGSTEDD